MIRRLVALFLAALLVVACSSGEGDDLSFDDDEETDSGDGGLEDPGDCATVDAAVSSEKIDLLIELAREFNQSDLAEVDGGCVFVRPRSKASGGAMQALAAGWDESVEGPRPVIWSPAASAWGAILNQRLEQRGEPAMAPEDARPFMLTPLVIAMPRPMADALGYPETPVGFADIIELARSEEGWGAYGHPEWGPFRLGKTNPNFSTSGLSALVAQAYAATGKTRGLTLEDLAKPEVQEFGRAVESAVVHYGDITMTFLNNWFRTDARGTSLTYASAVAVEEKSVIDYNRGNPDGVLDAGEQPREPRFPLVAIYPEEGTLFSDNPIFILDAPWVDDEQREGARRFEEFVRRPENQRKVLEFGFRPGNPEVDVAAPITRDNGVDPNQPETTLEVPAPPVMIDLLDRWANQRKSARVLLVLDVSGSMGDAASADTSETKLDLAKRAAIDALDEFKADDEVGLRIFSTNLGPQEDQDFIDLIPPAPMSDVRETMRTRIRDLFPTNGTPLYTATQTAYEAALDGFDPTRINAVVLLSDGVNDDGDLDDDEEQLEQLLQTLRAGSEGQDTRPVRVFTIAYGGDADKTTLRRMAEATNAASYDASDPASITRVFTAVVSNF